jgi:hypothetical protein
MCPRLARSAKAAARRAGRGRRAHAAAARRGVAAGAPHAAAADSRIAAGAPAAGSRWRSRRLPAGRCCRRRPGGFATGGALADRVRGGGLSGGWAATCESVARAAPRSCTGSRCAIRVHRPDLHWPGGARPDDARALAAVRAWPPRRCGGHAWRRALSLGCGTACAGAFAAVRASSSLRRPRLAPAAFAHFRHRFVTVHRRPRLVVAPLRRPPLGRALFAHFRHRFVTVHR